MLMLLYTRVLSLIFIPKIKYAKEGLPEGMTVMDSIGLQPSRQRSSLGVYNSRATSNSRASTPGMSQASYSVHNRHNSQTSCNSAGHNCHNSQPSYNSAVGSNTYERKASGGSRFGSINEDTKSDADIEGLMEGTDSSKPGDDIEWQLNEDNDESQSDDEIEHVIDIAECAEDGNVSEMSQRRGKRDKH